MKESEAFKELAKKELSAISPDETASMHQTAEDVAEKMVKSLDFMRGLSDTHSDDISDLLSAMYARVVRTLAEGDDRELTPELVKEWGGRLREYGPYMRMAFIMGYLEGKEGSLED